MNRCIEIYVHLSTSINLITHAWESEEGELAKMSLNKACAISVMSLILLRKSVKIVDPSFHFSKVEIGNECYTSRTDTLWAGCTLGMYLQAITRWSPRLWTIEWHNFNYKRWIAYHLAQKLYVALQYECWQPLVLWGHSTFILTAFSSRFSVRRAQKISITCRLAMV